mgnify:CR=1 FL=1
MTQHDRLLIIDFGSQVTQLIARRLRERYSKPRKRQRRGHLAHRREVRDVRHPLLREPRNLAGAHARPGEVARSSLSHFWLWPVA